MAATCCRRGKGEEYFEHLNRAFIEDPAIDEIDVIICPDCEKEQCKADGLVVVENHKMGVKSWGVKILFLYSYKRLMEHWRGSDKDCSFSATEVIQLTRSVLLFGPECYTAWNIRKELIASGVLSAAEDLQFSSLVLTKHPRSSETFTHRRWLILHLCKQHGERHFTQSWLRRELTVCCRAADQYPDNYTAWSHRGWVLQKFFKQDRKKLSSELHFLKQWVRMHVSDHCGFHYRQQLLRHFKNLCSPQETIALLMSELEVTRDLILAFPGHETLWYHRRFVVDFLMQWFVNTSRYEPSCLVNELGEKGVGSSGCKLTANTVNDGIGTRNLEVEASQMCCNSLEQGDSKSRVGGPVAPSGSEEHAFCTQVINISSGILGELQKKLATSHRQWVNLRTGNTEMALPVDSNRSKISHAS